MSKWRLDQHFIKAYQKKFGIILLRVQRYQKVTSVTSYMQDL